MGKEPKKRANLRSLLKKIEKKLWKHGSQIGWLFSLSSH